MLGHRDLFIGTVPARRGGPRVGPNCTSKWRGSFFACLIIQDCISLNAAPDYAGNRFGQEAAMGASAAGTLKTSA
jgi:hypothetical protein